MENSELANKKVLLISPSFFGYSNNIMKELERKGAIVSLYDERPSNHVFLKFIFRIRILNDFFARRVINNYFDSIFSDFLEDSFDYLLIINPECTPVEFLSRVKKANPKCKTIVYMWDSVLNKPSSQNYIEIVDSFFSFDKRDCSDRVKFQPLFYTNKPIDGENESVNKYQFSFVGTLHGNREKILVRIVSQTLGNKYYIYGFYHSKILRIIKKILTFDFFTNPPFKVEFKSLSYPNYLKSLSESNVVIDLPSQNQTGLTMRSIEVLGFKKKLITTNQDIVNYDFYNPNNIFIISGDNFLIPDDFFYSAYEDIDCDIYEQYSISSWVDSIFGVNNVQ
ncbi:hypothetical protein MHN79_09345 [Vibrio sp. Of14-4]|uniref:hypothetical protein n=1 Tax=Vibrio sp. Of14-4 TaxID=2724878 RepID=UPI001EF20E86|nr:hypothetical protein [Vibrio sp. Of14-4]MCG7489697.1 hypothetical protein [Vibrio sp. Of14-4]